MKKIFSILTIAVMLIMSISSCKKYLDINSDPDTPQFPNPSSVFPAQLAAIPRGLQFDARYAGRYIQNWNGSVTSTAADVNWDRMGYTAFSDANGDIWRQAYFGMGQNLNYIIDNGIKNEQWDYVGASYALKAMIFQYAVDYHGQIIFSDVFKDQAFFRFDDEEIIYRGVDSLARLALHYLLRTDVNAAVIKLAKGDYIYGGDVAKWIKFTNGILARNFHRYTNKSFYLSSGYADSVIAYCDKSILTVDEDFVIPFDAQKNEDANFFGTFRNNLTILRQSNFIVKLLDGTTLAGNNTQGYNRDPRMKHMLSISHDTTNGNGGYRGVDPGLGDPLSTFEAGSTSVLLKPWYTYAANSPNWLAARKKVAAPFGDTLYTNPSVANFSTNFRKYLFGDKVVFPIMSATEIQFMKAEAAFLKNDKATALSAYTNGINLHFDFINRTTMPRGNGQIFYQNPIPPTERAAYLASNNVKKSTATLQLSDIMLQKYIALWGWGFFETWVDMRRYHYTDPDPSSPTGAQVYLGFNFPSTLSGPNLGKPVYRVRPRYNSEYVWNRDELLRIGALNDDYHTYPTYFSRP